MMEVQRWMLARRCSPVRIPRVQLRRAPISTMPRRSTISLHGVLPDPLSPKGARGGGTRGLMRAVMVEELRCSFLMRPSRALHLTQADTS
ncbi:uncharacterized protein AB9W97_014084 isoform 2-T2 [Spinachia spinachia]